MTIYQQIVAACWGVLLVVWFVLALVRSPRLGRHTRRAWLQRLGIVVVLVIGVYLVILGRQPSVAVRPTPAMALTGAVLCVAGLAFAVWARVAMGEQWGAPMTQREQPALVTKGPFAHVRHPIYAGIIAMLIGSAINDPPAYVDVLLAAVSLVILARHEEREMLRLLPDAYPAYMKRTKRFVPFVF